MINMNNFSPPKRHDLITVCERNSLLISVYPGEENNEVKVFADEHLSSDRIKDSQIRHSDFSSGFLRNQMPFHIKLLSGWYNQGFKEFLNILSTMESDFAISKAISNIAKFGLQICEKLSTKDNLQSDLKNCYSPAIERHIRCLAWHPQTFCLAIVCKSDCIKVRKYDSMEETKLLHHTQQYNVFDVAWRPMHFVLAVACEMGIFIWDLEIKKIATSLNLSDYKILKHDGHSPVTSVSWQPCGTLLASSSSNQSSILIWKVEMDEYTPLKRLHVYGCPYVSWSPNGSRLFSSSTTSKFRIWETRTMTNDTWLKVNSKCQASCWSPDDRILLFASSEVPIIYSVTFKLALEGLVEEGQIAPVINVAQYTYIVDGFNMEVGGFVDSLEWDSHGERLAVLFKRDVSPRHIALYHTRYSPKFSSVPIGFITGLMEEYATHMKFMPSFESGSLLSIAWSTGRLTHIPLYYTPSKSTLSSLFAKYINTNEQ